MSDPLKPSASLLCKLGSIVVHVEEGTSKDGHPFDMVSLRTLMCDAEIITWLAAMDKMAMIPKKRK